jgi:hypothetical protein
VEGSTPLGATTSAPPPSLTRAPAIPSQPIQSESTSLAKIANEFAPRKTATASTWPLPTVSYAIRVPSADVACAGEPSFIEILRALRRFASPTLFDSLTRKDSKSDAYLLATRQ